MQNGPHAYLSARRQKTKTRLKSSSEFGVQSAELVEMRNGISPMALGIDD